MHKKSNIVVGITTFNNEMLRVSVPWIGKIRQKFTLVIYNDNPMATITRRQIRRLGYCGDLIIINSDENVGQFRARMAIVDTAREIHPKWIIFCDDDDILSDTDIPNVAKRQYSHFQTYEQEGVIPLTNFTTYQEAIRTGRFDIAIPVGRLDRSIPTEDGSEEAKQQGEEQQTNEKDGFKLLV